MINCCFSLLFLEIVNKNRMQTSDWKQIKWNSRRKLHAVKKWSYLSGAADHPLIGITIGQLMEQAAEFHPDKEAFVFCEQGLKLNFEQLIQQVLD